MTISSAFGLNGRRCVHAVRLAGRSLLFLGEALGYGFVPPLKIRRSLEQIVFIGAKSLIIIFVTALSTGMVLALEALHMLRGGATENILGALVALSIVRELGPVLSALIVTGRAGSAMTAEIGIMRLTEQIDALEMMAVNPIKHVVTPKIVAGVVSMPVLCAFFDVVGILGGYFVGVVIYGVPEVHFFGGMTKAVAYLDVAGGLFKSAVFGLAMSWICSMMGYGAAATAEGVSRATTNAVVITSIAVLVLDYMVTSLLL
ncbi:MlaE family lipid ABC transporter permease subunit [Syntrophobacter fumaroxidans]|uniref:ABC transporter permease n=1 Tax=Syntrophobacter fumaroxidans (strain DSM 10017 / MPOB) TaxID=335543 RepID=A0LFA0_SYNFM|nr:MlaE family lipid ABC transporter permease subunit [Syntrophobacter fumaroxidans]ABK16102.1 protein of unknown function DUF140 [Syntrophobacter fumaroxidans MPOB]